MRRHAVALRLRQKRGFASFIIKAKTRTIIRTAAAAVRGVVVYLGCSYYYNAVQASSTQVGVVNLGYYNSTYYTNIRVGEGSGEKSSTSSYRIVRLRICIRVRRETLWGKKQENPTANNIAIAMKPRKNRYKVSSYTKKGPTTNRFRSRRIISRRILASGEGVERTW